MERRDTSRSRDRWALAVLLAIATLAIVLRMGWPALAEFKLDEALVVRRALAIAYEGDRPLVGAIASVGTFHMPFNLYLMAIPLRIWPDPLAAVLFVGLLNGLAVLACYGLCRAVLGRAVGLVAAFLFAVNPWAVLFGRKIWSQNLPLVTLGFFAALFAAFVGGRRWALVGAFAALAALIGFHLGGLAFIVVLLVPMLLYRERVALWPLLVGLLVFALVLSPYVVHDALCGWSNLGGFLRYTGGEGRFAWDALRYAFLLATGRGVQAVAGSRSQEFVAGLPHLWWLDWLVMGLLGLALLYGVFLAVREPRGRGRAILLLLLWFAVPVLLQSRPTTPVYAHYFILLYPVQFILIAVVLVDAFRRFPIPGRRTRIPALLLAVGLLFFGGWQVAIAGRLFAFMDRYPTTGGYGIPLKYPRAAAQEARQLAGSSEVIVLSTAADPKTETTPAVFEALLFGHPHRFADGRWALPVPDSPGVVYLVGPVGESVESLQPAQEQLEGMAYVQPGVVVALPDGWEYRFFRRDGPDREDVVADLDRFPDAVPLANGVAFLGYEMAGQVHAEGTLEVWLAWWVQAPPPPGADYHFFAHLLDAGEGLRSQHDGAMFPTDSWQAGDLVLSRFPIPVPSDLPPGYYRVRTGVYTYPGVVGVPVVDVAGNPAGDWVGLGEVEVIQ